jgi:hypothetical protein
MNSLCVLHHPDVIRLFALFRESDQATAAMNSVAAFFFGILLPQLKEDHLKHFMKGCWRRLRFFMTRSSSIAM